MSSAFREEEQRLLAIAKGEREVAERQAAAKVEQIQRTTDAETDKQLALTEARKRQEQADIDRQTAGIRLAQAKIDAEARTVAADAAAYEKKAILLADNALQQKLDAYVKAQSYWADAFAKRQVPTQVFGTSAQGPGQRRRRPGLHEYPDHEGGPRSECRSFNRLKGHPISTCPPGGAGSLENRPLF